MDILVSRTLYMSCQAGPGIEPGPSAMKASVLPIELFLIPFEAHPFQNKLYGFPQFPQTFISIIIFIWSEHEFVFLLI